MVALSRLAQDILGTGTQIFGAPCIATSPASLGVLIGAGAIYSMAALEPSAWSSLPLDANQVLKQGIIPAAGVTLLTPAPPTAGQSVSYLVEGQFQEVDSNFLTLSYFNAANPLQPFSGAGNSGIAQPTIRAGNFAVQVKAGNPATTGTQVPPTVDAGWTAMYVVTVDHGQTTVTSSNISVVSGIPTQAPIVQASGSFLISLDGGFVSTQNGLINYERIGNIVSLVAKLQISGSSNADTFSSSTPLPSIIAPATSFSEVPCWWIDGGNPAVGFAGLSAAGIAPSLSKTLSGTNPQSVNANATTINWSSSGTKGFPQGWSVTYPVT